MSYVRSYTRRDGVRVRGHYRKQPSRGGGRGGGDLLAVLVMVLIIVAVIAH